MPERRGRKSDSQTPAPPADRIVGSKKNPKGSASSEDSAKKIVLSPTVKNTLKRKLEIFKEKYPKSENVTFEDLKAVYRRGTGAYSSTHRPTITGGVPNSRSAWGIARVNKFLEKAAGEKVKKAYVQDDDLLKYENDGLVGFNEDFKKWHKKVNQKINVFISSIHDLNKPVASPDHNSVILHLFEKNDETIDAKVHLKELTDLADKHKITIYLQPIPSHKNLSESKKKKITKDYLKSYYEKFGFIEVSDGWMERKPHSKYEDGGLTHSLEMAMTNLKKNGIVIKHDGITLIAYNTGNHERQPSLYRKAIMYDAIHPKKQAAEIIEKFDKGQYENFDENEIQEYKNSHLIIINQNEVIYDSKKPNMMYADGGELNYTNMKNENEELKKELKLNDFNPYKSIEQIAEEKNVPIDYARKQLEIGMSIESEHSSDELVQEIIALQHLDEMIDYYEKLELVDQKYAEGGKVEGDGKLSDDAKDGGLFKGKSHAEGGIKAVNNDTGQLIEVEGNEVIINKRSVADTTKKEFEGEMLTNREILSRINESGGGVSFDKGGKVDLSNDDEIEETNIFLIKSENINHPEDLPILETGSIVYAVSQNGSLDEWYLEFFTKDSIILTHKPKNKLSIKSMPKQISFDELKDMYKKGEVQIKNINNERELGLLIELLKEKINSLDSYEKGGLIFKQDDSEDEKMMQEQFGNENIL